jgi:hypothetical protein
MRTGLRTTQRGETTNKFFIGLALASFIHSAFKPRSGGQ